MDGVIDTDVYHEAHINTFFTAPINEEITLSRGMPLAQIIPFKREEYKMETVVGNYNSLTVWDWVSGDLIVNYSGTSQYDFTLGSSSTSWDRMINDYATGGGTSNIYIYSGVDTNNAGADYTSIYITPPSSRSFSNININPYSITYASSDYSASTIFASYYGNGSGSYAYHDLFFDLT